MHIERLVMSNYVEQTGPSLCMAHLEHGVLINPAADQVLERGKGKDKGCAYSSISLIIN